MPCDDPDPHTDRRALVRILPSLQGSEFAAERAKESKTVLKTTNVHREALSTEGLFLQVQHLMSNRSRNPRLTRIQPPVTLVSSHVIEFRWMVLEDKISLFFSNDGLCRSLGQTIVIDLFLKLTLDVAFHEIHLRRIGHPEGELCSTNFGAVGHKGQPRIVHLPWLQCREPHTQFTKSCPLSRVHTFR